MTKTAILSSRDKRSSIVAPPGKMPSPMRYLGWMTILLLLTGQSAHSNSDGESIRRGKSRRSHCYDWQSRHIGEGEEYTPDKHEPCRICTCNDGIPAMCLSVRCSPPTDCPFYEQIEGECCKYHCPNPSHPKGKMNNNPNNNTTVKLPPKSKPPIIGPDETTNLGLRLVASTVTSFLILALLLFMIHRLRRRRMLLMMQRMHHHRRGDRSSDVVTAAYVSEYDDMDVGPFDEPPPPYSPPRPPRFLPRDAPPPYETLPTSASGELTAALNATLARRQAQNTNSISRISNASIALVNGTLTFRVSNQIDDRGTCRNHRGEDRALNTITTATPSDDSMAVMDTSRAEQNNNSSSNHHVDPHHNHHHHHHHHQSTQQPRSAEYQPVDSVDACDEHLLHQRDFAPSDHPVETERLRQRSDTTSTSSPHYENFASLRMREQAALAQQQQTAAEMTSRNEETDDYVEMDVLGHNNNALCEATGDEDVLPRSFNTDRLFSQFSCTDSDDSDSNFRRDSLSLPRRTHHVPRSRTTNSFEIGRSADQRFRPMINDLRTSYLKRLEDGDLGRLRDSPLTSYSNDEDNDDQSAAFDPYSIEDTSVSDQAFSTSATRRPCYRTNTLSPIVLEESDARKVVWSSPERAADLGAYSGPHVHDRFRIGKFGSPEKRNGSRSDGSPNRIYYRRSLPPMSLQLDEDSDCLEAESLPFSPTSPDIYPGAKQFQSPITPVRDSTSTYEGNTCELAPGTPMLPVQPIQPVYAPLMRSNSLGSQISCVSVCSETGEKRKRGRNIPPSNRRSSSPPRRKFPSMSSVTLASIPQCMGRFESTASICSCPGDYSCPGDLDSEDISTIPMSQSFGGAKPKTARRKSRKNSQRKGKAKVHRNVGDNVDNDSYQLLKQESMDDNGNFDLEAEQRTQYTQYGFIDDIPWTSGATPVDSETIAQVGGANSLLPQRRVLNATANKPRCVDDAMLDSRYRALRASPGGSKSKAKAWRKKARQTVSFERPDFPSPTQDDVQHRPVSTFVDLNVDDNFTMFNLSETSI